MNKIDSLSIVIPVYNEKDVIAEVIRSFHQEVICKIPHSRLIIAENGSTDGTKKILEELRKEIPFHLISGEERKGYTKAFKIDYTARDFQDKIFLNAEVEKLTRNNGKWEIRTNDGTKREADKIISTIPLVELIKKIDLDGMEKNYAALRWNNTFFVAVGLKKGHSFDLIKNCHWVFFKEKEVFY